MWNWLQKMQSKPASEKKKIAYGVSTFFSLVILFVWWVSADSGVVRFQSADADQYSQVSPLSEIGKSAAFMKNSLSAQFSDLKNILQKKK